MNREYKLYEDLSNTSTIIIFISVFFGITSLMFDTNRIVTVIQITLLFCGMMVFFLAEIIWRLSRKRRFISDLY